MFLTLEERTVFGVGFPTYRSYSFTKISKWLKSGLYTERSMGREYGHPFPDTDFL